MEDEYMFCVNTLSELRKLPQELKGKNRPQRMALFFHFTMLRFQFQPQWEDKNEEGGVGSSTQSAKGGEQPNLRAGWNANLGFFEFRYRHTLLPSPVLLKIIPMDNLLLVHCTTQTDNPPLHSLEISMNDHISEYMTENEGEYKWKALQVLFKNAIVYPLLPSLKPSSPSSPSTGPTVEIRGAKGDPLRPPNFASNNPPLVSPYSVGHNDAFPNFSGGGWQGIGSGGMEVGPNHSMFSNYPPPPGFGDDDNDFHFDPNGPLPGGPPRFDPVGPRFDPVGPLPSQNKKKDKRSPFGPDPDHLPMPGGDKDWYI